MFIKQIAIDHSVRLAKDRKSITAFLEAQHENLLRHIDPNDSAQRARLLEIKDSLKVIEDELEGIKIRSKENWLEFGQKPTKYFFQLENKKQTKNAINALRVGSVTVQTEILASALDCYKSLYTEEPVDEASQDWLLSQLDKTLAFEDQAKCEGELTL